ncbi:hypothetical protein CO174_02090 [Candidatus Uhrbacteria bacterium CG_4_9_14_3_um_filter_50_9]|uniref:Leucine-binding protein domain-containing protein n=1 Tax=Candidatus Uhrbacteria bacterium CG_4_9_14_3_um_filter_50_9 TaxID=1975035 RepID=A0A2M7XCV4_9BACT|nr:MAG: hypothetical protein CO174_02090 [Candidatus Uhrbacteria bacterium CG_4_9_14_3_um_filter_50_9]
MAEQTNNGLLWAIGIILIILGIIYFSVVGGPPQVVTIGVLTPASSDELQRAYDIAASQINAEGGIEGKTLELTHLTGDCEGENLQSELETFLAESQVKVLLGGVCDSSDALVAQVAQEQGVLLLSPFLLMGETQTNNSAFHIVPSQENLVDLIIAHATADGSVRATVVFENTQMGQEVQAAFLEAYNAWYEYAEPYETDQVDFTNTISRVKAANPDTVFVVAETQETSVLLLSQLKESGLNVAFYGTEVFVDPVAMSENASLYEEMIFPVMVAAQNDEFVRMYNAYQEMYGTGPTDFTSTAIAYDSVFLIAEALLGEDQGSEAVAQRLSEQSDWSGAVGPLSFDENRTATLPLTLVQVVGGQFTELAQAE